MKSNSFVRKQRQLINLSKRLNYLLVTGKWEQLQESVKAKLIAKLNPLYHLLQNYFSFSSIKKILAGAAVFITLPIISKSQTFEPPVLNPFGYAVVDTTTIITPVFADIDGDEDMDLFAGGYGGSIQFFQNIGSKTTPEYTTPQLNPFGLTPVGEYIFLAKADIDSDGDIDLFSGATDGKLRYYKNTGTPTLPVFNAPVVNPFGYTSVEEFSIPAFADIDNDGDLDLFVCEYYGVLKYFENNGTTALPHFAAPVSDPFGITPAEGFGFSAFADLDFDGDLDLLQGEYYGNTRFFENTGSVISPAFASPIINPFGIVQTDYYSFPALADIDNDGDLDLFIAEAYGDIQYFENTDFNVGFANSEADEVFELYPNPASDKVILSLKDGIFSGSEKVLIYDFNGRAIAEFTINSQLTTLSLDKFAQGIYYVKVFGIRGTVSRKLIVR
jgi:hypothetical protein